MKKIISIILVLAVVGLGGYFLFVKKPFAPPSGQLASEVPSAQEFLITYTDAGYYPNEITVKVGGKVTFKNESGAQMWTASALHPTHREYPTTGGCIGSTFDTCKGIPPGESWSFKFDIPGTWRYHNHLSPSHFGRVVVE